MSASLRHSAATIQRSRPCWNARSLISSRSTIHSITAGLKKPSCHWPPKVGAGVLTAVALRQRKIIPGGAWQGIAGLGAGVRELLGTVFPEIFARRPACDRGDPGHRRSPPYGGQCRRDARPTARSRSTSSNGRVRRIALIDDLEFGRLNRFSSAACQTGRAARP